MHMNSAPHLLREDRPEFERILDETLRTAHLQPGLSGVGPRLGRAQLRSMAMSAAIPIAACADAEYQHFVALRTELRRPPPEHSVPGRDPHHAPSSAVVDRHGAGLVAVVSVLAPLLAGTAAVIFLLVGYVLHLLEPEPALAAPMRNAGWTFAVLAAGTALLGMGGMLLTALRNGPSAVAAGPKVRRARIGGTGGPATGAGEDLAAAVAAARAAWRAALLERGILPFLREALADPAGAEKSPEALARELPQAPPRTPRLGYSHPGFSSPATTSRDGGSGDAAATRPRFSSPEYASPDYEGPAYGGPETRPE
jgi:hypothetical protein